MNKILIIILLGLISIRGKTQLIIPSENLDTIFRESTMDSLYKYLYKSCKDYHFYKHCIDTTRIFVDINYRLIADDNILSYDSSMNLIDYLTIDTLHPGTVFVYYNNKFIGTGGFDYMGFYFNSLLEIKGDRIAIKSIKKLENIYRKMKNFKPELIFTLDCGFSTYGYLKNDLLYLYDSNINNFIKADYYINNYKLVPVIKNWYRSLKLKVN